MPVLKTLKNGKWINVSGISEHTHTKNDITDLQEKVYTQPDEPIDAPVGAVWVDTDEDVGFGSGTGGGTSIDVTAEVGQTIVVEEVDNSGKPAKWKAADYQERICGTGFVNEIVPFTEVTPIYNETLGMPNANLNDFELVAGEKYKVVYDGVEYVCEAIPGTFSGMDFIALGNQMLAGGPDTGHPFGVGKITQAPAGFVICMDMNLHSVQVFGEGVEKIPSKYIPSLEEMLSEVILPETMVEIDPVENMGMINAEISLVAGKVYTVKYNGVEYSNCECLDLKGLGVDTLALGNLGAILPDFPETQHPFIIADISGTNESGNINRVWACAPLDGSTSVTLSIFGESKIPDSLPQVSNNDNGAFLRVVDGVWAVAKLSNAEDGEF